jgi:hypothetical protein
MKALVFVPQGKLGCDLAARFYCTVHNENCCAVIAETHLQRNQILHFYNCT